MFKVGRAYQRQKIHDLFGGERQKGISQPAGHDVIFLFSHNGGEVVGIGDGWIDNQTFQYLGEGSKGDMAFTSGNLAIRDHVQLGKTLLLFSKVAPKTVRFEGEMIYSGHELLPNVPDAMGQPRTVIVMRLKRRSSAPEIGSRS
jgi:5-methylcytosine-specific restriction enzyme A